MSKVRRRVLPAGWYPSSAEKAEKVLESWSSSQEPVCKDAFACVVPHAGWEFSGELAFSGIRSLKNPADTVVVVGGHLPPKPGVVVAPADYFETPFGYIEADVEFIQTLGGQIEFADDTKADNTVEIQLPIVKYLFDGAKLVYMRVAPTHEAITVGKKLKTVASSLGRKTVVIGSTDLTHYGPSYGFTPAGSGSDAEEWVRNTNDKRFLEHLLNFEIDEALKDAQINSSACSAGGAAVAATFAEASGATKGVLVGRRMSSDVYKADSFVGYGTVAYVR